jgi:hypothetical protein
VAESQKGVTLKIWCWMTKTSMLHNITVQFGLQWILQNDLSNGKWNTKLGNTENRTDKA